MTNIFVGNLSSDTKQEAVRSLFEPVSYTHLDVYKRQGLRGCPKYSSRGRRRHVMVGQKTVRAFASERKIAAEPTI